MPQRVVAQLEAILGEPFSLAFENQTPLALEALPFSMAKRKPMTFRRVPLRSNAAGDARVSGSVDERLALVRELSLSAWRGTGRTLPAYDRATLPFRRARLGERRDRD